MHHSGGLLRLAADGKKSLVGGKTELQRCIREERSDSCQLGILEVDGSAILLVRIR